MQTLAELFEEEEARLLREANTPEARAALERAMRRAREEIANMPDVPETEEDNESEEE